MTNDTEWLCRGCEVDVEKLIIQRELIPSTVSATGHVIEGSPQVVYSFVGLCSKCGKVRRLYEYEASAMKEPEKAPEAILTPRQKGMSDTVEPVIVAESVEAVGEVVVESVLEEIPTIDETIDKIAEMPIEAIEEALEVSEKEAEIAALKAQIEALEAE